MTTQMTLCGIDALMIAFTAGCTIHDNLHVCSKALLQKLRHKCYAGDILTFVSGTEEGGEEHAASLIGLARSLLQLCDGLRLPNEAPLRLQLSMHTGTVVSGLVGELNMKYG